MQRAVAFREKRDSLNAERGYSWESNPWVWVYEFMRMEKYSEKFTGNKNERQAANS